jgi:hypothetical protein
VRIKTIESQQINDTKITEGYHRTIVINPTTLDYICIPAHKLREGEIEEAEAELKDA